MNLFFLFLAALWRIGYLIDSKTRLAKKKNYFATPLIGVGSLLAGGAGKTPYTAFLAEQLKQQGFSVAILCKKTGDENLWLEKKGFEVFAGNRLKMRKELDGKFDVLISDDGLEDRRLNAFWVCLSWGERANSLKDIIPAGNCRSLWIDHPEISCVKRCAMEWSRYAAQADIVFSMKAPTNAKGDVLPANSKVIALAGIARPHRFFTGIERNYSVAKKIHCRDHSKNIQKKIEQALKFGLPVVVTEKDSVKLSESVLMSENVYVCELELALSKLNAVFKRRSL